MLLPTIFYGVIAAGGVYSAASSAYLPLELARQIKQGESNLIVCSADCKDVAVKAARECGIPLDRVLELESMGGPRYLKSVASERNLIEGSSGPELDWERVSDKNTLENRIICMLYSSGTTGAPKGKLSTRGFPHHRHFSVTSPSLTDHT